MNLIQNEPPFKPPAFLSGKKKWILAGVLLVLLVGANLLSQLTGAGKSQREIDYVEGMRTPADHADSVVLLSLYSKLNGVYDLINATDLDSLTKFSDIKKESLPGGFYTKVISYHVLQMVFDTLQRENAPKLTHGNFFTDVTASMGNGDFAENFTARKFQKGFAGDARHILDEKYVMVLVPYELIPPNSIEGSDTFETGSFIGGILVYDLSIMKLVAYDRFATTNSAEVQSGPYVKEKIDQTLMNNLEKNIGMHVNDISAAFFGKNVWPRN
jgi:hypothetical protein